MRLRRLTTTGAAFALFCCADAFGQTPAPAATPTPDLSITAHVTARELLFRKVPNARVDFTGKPERQTVWEADRENLPGEVRPGVTYRDIGIRLRITSVFADIDRIVAEALGELPASEAPPPEPQPQTPPPTLSSPASADSAAHVRTTARARRARRGNRR